MTLKDEVVKRDQSSDDLFQSLVGAFYLSDTVSAAGSDDVTGLYPDRMNIIGGKSALKFLKF